MTPSLRGSAPTTQRRLRGGGQERHAKQCSRTARRGQVPIPPLQTSLPCGRSSDNTSLQARAPGDNTSRPGFIPAGGGPQRGRFLYRPQGGHRGRWAYGEEETLQQHYTQAPSLYSWGLGEGVGLVKSAGSAAKAYTGPSTPVLAPQLFARGLPLCWGRGGM